jgi:ATP-dependent exoDNAse (exonuclease V) alpha subunit
MTALAGSGKTTLIGALAECCQAAGWQVIGAAPTGRAARQLRDTAGIPAETIHTLPLQLAGTTAYRSGPCWYWTRQEWHPPG